MRRDLLRVLFYAVEDSWGNDVQLQLYDAETRLVQRVMYSRHRAQKKILSEEELKHQFAYVSSQLERGESTFLPCSALQLQLHDPYLVISITTAHYFYIADGDKMVRGSHDCAARV